MKQIIPIIINSKGCAALGLLGGRKGLAKAGGQALAAMALFLSLSALAGEGHSEAQNSLKYPANHEAAQGEEERVEEPSNNPAASAEPEGANESAAGSGGEDDFENEPGGEEELSALTQRFEELAQQQGLREFVICKCINPYYHIYPRKPFVIVGAGRTADSALREANFKCNKKALNRPPTANCINMNAAEAVWTLAAIQTGIIKARLRARQAGFTHNFSVQQQGEER